MTKETKKEWKLTTRIILDRLERMAFLDSDQAKVEALLRPEFARFSEMRRQKLFSILTLTEIINDELAKEGIAPIKEGVVRRAWDAIAGKPADGKEKADSKPAASEGPWDDADPTKKP